MKLLFCSVILKWLSNRNSVHSRLWTLCFMYTYTVIQSYKCNIIQILVLIYHLVKNSHVKDNYFWKIESIQNITPSNQDLINISSNWANTDLWLYIQFSCELSFEMCPCGRQNKSTCNCYSQYEEITHINLNMTNIYYTDFSSNTEMFPQHLIFMHTSTFMCVVL